MKDDELVQFMSSWSRGLVICLILCLAFAPMQLWLALSRDVPSKPRRSGG